MTAMKRTLLSVVAAVMLLLGFAPVASATMATPDPFGCKTVPVAESPTDGISGWLLPAPKSPPRSVDKTSGTSLLQNFGVSGLSWFTFDDDCDYGVGGITDKPGETTNGVASAVFLPGVLIAAATVSAGNAFGNPDWLEFLNPILGEVSKALSEAFTQPLMPLFVIITAIVAMLAASAGKLSKVLRAGVFVLLGLAVVGLTVGYPVKAATVVDDTVSSLVLTGQQTIVTGKDSEPSAADREQPGAAFVGPLYKSLVWDTWLRGQLGSDDSAVAKKYGYALYEARTLTYAEKATVDRDPKGAGADVFEAKSKKFKEVADKIKDEDPSAYNVLTSSNFGQRFGLAIGSSGIALTAFSLPFLSFVLLLLCFLYWRFTVMLGPMLGAVMVMMHSVARSVAKKLGAVVLNTVMFGIGAGVYVAMARFVTSSTLPFGWQVLCLAVLTVVGWVILHPIRALTKFTEINTPGYDGVPGGDLAKQGVKAAVQYMITRKAAGDGIGDAAEDLDDSENPKGDNPSPSPNPRPRPTHQWDAGPAVIESAPVHRELGPAPHPAREGVVLDAPQIENTPVASPQSPEVIDGEVLTRHIVEPHPVDSRDFDEVEPARTVEVLTVPEDGIDRGSEMDDTGWVYYDASSKSFVSSGGLETDEGEQV